MTLSLTLTMGISQLGHRSVLEHATTESRVEPDVSSVCPTPSPSQTPRSYAEVVVGPTTTQGSGSLVRSQHSEVNFRRSC